MELLPIKEAVREIIPEGKSVTPGQTDGVPDVPMYILRCGKGARATAAAFLYESVLREFAGRHGDFYILPSSVSETILLPAANAGKRDSGYYSSVVGEVNRTLCPEDVLADNAYLYHADTGETEILP